MNLTHATMSLVTLFLVGACGGGDGAPDDSPVTPPPNDPRPLPVQGLPDDNEDMGPQMFDGGNLEEPDASEPSTDVDELVCCPVTFALADDNNMNDEISVTLQGSAPPLNEGLPMEYKDGVWSVDTCVHSDHVGYYSYIVERDEEGLILERSIINEFAPRASNVGIESNIWLTSASCEDSQVETHAKVSQDP